MSSPDIVGVRQKIDAERTLLNEHLTALTGELRSALPFLVAGFVTAAALGVVFVRLRGGKRRARSVTITWELT